MMYHTVRLILLSAICMVIFSACRQTEPPALPGTFPVTEISGNLSDWSDGEAYVNLVGKFDFSFVSDPDGTRIEEIELHPPFYGGSISAAGVFRVALSTPDPATLEPLGCTANDPVVAVIGGAIASSVPTPTNGDEIISFYTYVGPQRPIEQAALWLYTPEATKIKGDCTSPTQMGFQSVDLNLAPGWNQLVASISKDGLALSSKAPPESFDWFGQEFAPLTVATHAIN